MKFRFKFKDFIYIIVLLFVLLLIFYFIYSFKETFGHPLNSDLINNKVYYSKKLDLISSFKKDYIIFKVEDDELIFTEFEYTSNTLIIENGEEDIYVIRVDEDTLYITNWNKYLFEYKGGGSWWILLKRIID